MLQISLAIVAGIFALAGCGSIDQIPDSDYTWEERTLAISYQQAYRNVWEVLRACPGHSIDGNLYANIKQARIDVYFTTMLGDRAPTVRGVIRIESVSESSSKVRVGVRNRFDGPGLLGLGTKGATRKKWLDWAAGDVAC